MVKNPKFKLAFLGPRFWLTWLGVLFLYLISWLPFFLQIQMGKGLGYLVHRFAKKRKHIAEVNIKLCFPQMSEGEQAKLVYQNMQQTGIAIFESGMAWWWPKWRVEKHFGSITGYEHIQAIQAQGYGVLMLVPHMLHLEMAGRVMGLSQEGVGFYRPHNNALMEFLMTRGRLRSNEYLIGKRDIKGLLATLKNGKLCYYLPDQDYGRKRAEFAPFFAVKETATTTGTTLFASSKHCKTVCFMSRRDEQGQYHLAITPMPEDFPSGNDLADVTLVNQAIERAVINAPAQYMWLHRRFKTRPDENSPSYY
ncbi:LpxL/LpxP family Kdo(2)-lipid IV(A) lauroyl/palmitoleoyl acyltransferase [Pseudoalteromonas tunicata]|uniref:Lipid A biosynthesis acyltransferase n=1 Tax=Pseudoalteromonas tunicata D2 TaxID=87626 RepID=A4C950_9GAMM|nr:LpxL/LpxP family Kdo(2)-lipid IV(A) lauroyl/palmitoleoyl acyltransferase [Pseudoalteromonas tunicata]ATC93617.1 lipid A biosynthesis lauroyl acyltransferase [Pseudoalteromonas tunicata]AXT29452.1 LpxL/LpxP family Kdo(2)-lipid IV(A) lauroyl/palmitoleoyl acyltransferase [Pseudoalteromonas tunicata]EAR29115.1 Lipid A biosynthesis lauroyl acyltransferase [Pseudoalteromonas tunicata D2]MDP4983168.1 LpxL/LpxP family Kdo(2)-lipid IV(A) lauroyl/palmitoleoyl acyltransferase [Pseudoalteromonas tunicat